MKIKTYNSLYYKILVCYNYAQVIKQICFPFVGTDTIGVGRTKSLYLETHSEISYAHMSETFGAGLGQAKPELGLEASI